MTNPYYVCCATNRMRDKIVLTFLTFHITHTRWKKISMAVFDNLKIFKIALPTCSWLSNISIFIILRSWSALSMKLNYLNISINHMGMIEFISEASLKNWILPNLFYHQTFLLLYLYTRKSILQSIPSLRKILQKAPFICWRLLNEQKKDRNVSWVYNPFQPFIS